MPLSLLHCHILPVNLLWLKVPLAECLSMKNRWWECVPRGGSLKGKIVSRPWTRTNDSGLSSPFYHPHVCCGWLLNEVQGLGWMVDFTWQLYTFSVCFWDSLTKLAIWFPGFLVAVSRNTQFPVHLRKSRLTYTSLRWDSEHHSVFRSNIWLCTLKRRFWLRHKHWPRLWTTLSGICGVAWCLVSHWDYTWPASV